MFLLLQSNFVNHLFIQKNNALRTDSTRRQWVDLGIHTDVCMTRPETCGTDGGAISMWLKISMHHTECSTKTQCFIYK